MTSICRAVGAAVAGSHCDTWRLYLRRQRQLQAVDDDAEVTRRLRDVVLTPPEPPKRWLSLAVVENPTTSPGSCWGSVEVGWASTMPRCRRYTQWDVGRQPQRHRDAQRGKRRIPAVARWGRPYCLCPKHCPKASVRLPMHAWRAITLRWQEN